MLGTGIDNVLTLNFWTNILDLLYWVTDFLLLREWSLFKTRVGTEDKMVG